MLEILQANAGLAPGVAFVFGLLVGSFLNVVILRLPPWLEWHWRREAREILELPESDAPAPPGIVVQSSACPKCGHKLAAWENLPLISFVLLRGRCRGCGTSISWQYPAVELMTGLAFAACIWRFGPGAEGVAAMVATGLLIAMAGIDARTTLLPDGMTYPLLWLGLAISPWALFVTPVQAIVGALVGYLSLWSVYWGFKLLTGKEGMGHGDFKLLAALGAWCGAWAILPIALMSSLLGAAVGIGMIVLRGHDRAVPLPFGPFLAAAGWVQLLWGAHLQRAFAALLAFE